ncbi:MAG: hypothetical protein WCI34_04785 [Actinomycetes bacterium]
MKNATLEDISVGTAASLCVAVAESQGWTASLPSDRKIELRRGGAIFGSVGITVWLTDAGDDISLTCEGSAADAEQLVDAIQAGVTSAVAAASLGQAAQAQATSSIGENAPAITTPTSGPAQRAPLAAPWVPAQMAEPAITRAIRNGAKTGVAYTLSAIFPGLGHLYLQSLIPGAVLFVGQGATIYAAIYYATVVRISDAAAAIDGSPSSVTGDKVGLLVCLALWIGIWVGALWSISTSAAQARAGGVDN